MSEHDRVLLATTAEIPGYMTTGYSGVVMGVVAASRDAVSDMRAGIKSAVGGEIKGYTRLLEDVRALAVARLRENAHAAGANAVVGLRFDSGELSGGVQMVAYGTAVVVEPQA